MDPVAQQIALRIGALTIENATLLYQLQEANSLIESQKQQIAELTAAAAAAKE